MRRAGHRCPAQPVASCVMTTTQREPPPTCQAAGRTWEMQGGPAVRPAQSPIPAQARHGRPIWEKRIGRRRPPARAKRPAPRSPGRGRLWSAWWCLIRRRLSRRLAPCSANQASAFLSTTSRLSASAWRMYLARWDDWRPHSVATNCVPAAGTSHSAGSTSPAGFGGRVPHPGPTAARGRLWAECRAWSTVTGRAGRRGTSQRSGCPGVRQPRGSQCGAWSPDGWVLRLQADVAGPPTAPPGPARCRNPVKKFGFVTFFARRSRLFLKYARCATHGPITRGRYGTSRPPCACPTAGPRHVRRGEQIDVKLMSPDTRCPGRATEDSPRHPPPGDRLPTDAVDINRKKTGERPCTATT
jgi:hypothetical protein